MNTRVVWLHADSLSTTDPALLANPHAPAVYIFNEGFLRELGLSFKRLLFVYECAVEALEGRDGEIRRGELLPELLDFCMQHSAVELHVTESVSPRFKHDLARLRQHMLVVTYRPPALITWNGAAPRRFSRFWRKVQDEALQPTGNGPPELQDGEQQQ